MIYFFFFFFNDTATTEIYTLSLHDALPISNAYHGARIVVNGALVEYWIDERQVLGCDLASEELAERIARSRFRDFAQFGQLREGHIVLQHRGTEAWFRRLRIEVL